MLFVLIVSRVTMYNPQVQEFTVHLPSNAGHKSNTSSSFEVVFDREKVLDEHYDWYVATKELFLPSVQQPKTSWKGTITLHPAQSEAPFAAKAKNGLTDPMQPITKTYTFQMSDVTGGKIFKPNNRSYTDGAKAYLRAKIKDAGTSQDEWDYKSNNVIQRFKLKNIPAGADQDSNFVEPTDWGRMEFRGFFNSHFKLPRIIEPSLESHKAKWTSGYNPSDYIVLKDLQNNKEHRVGISPSIFIGHMKVINNQLKDLSLPGNITVQYRQAVGGMYPFPAGQLKVVFDYPTFTISIPTSSITSTSAEEIIALELYPAYFNDLLLTQTALKIKILNWHRCTDKACVQINDVSTQSGQTPTVGSAGFFLHIHTDVMGPILWHYEEDVNHFHIPIVPPKNKAGKKQEARYEDKNRLQFNHSVPLTLDLDQPSGSVDVDTRIECRDLLDYSQQYFTKPSNTNLLRRIRRRLKEGNASDLE